MERPQYINKRKSMKELNARCSVETSKSKTLYGGLTIDDVRINYCYEQLLG